VKAVASYRSKERVTLLRVERRIFEAQKCQELLLAHEAKKDEGEKGRAERDSDAAHS